jgi:hypothetical protein
MNESKLPGFGCSGEKTNSTLNCQNNTFQYNH